MITAQTITALTISELADGLFGCPEKIFIERIVRERPDDAIRLYSITENRELALAFVIRYANSGKYGQAAYFMQRELADTISERPVHTPPEFNWELEKIRKSRGCFLETYPLDA